MKKLIILIIGVILLNSAKAQNSHPNIIWLMAEDISLDLECYGMPAVRTPNLNKMAEEGIRFDNCMVTNSICSPSRSAMMVGVHQMKINAHNHRSNRNKILKPPYQPFTQLLREQGYTTILGHHAVMKQGRKIDVNFKHQPIGPWNGVDQFGLFDKYDRFEKEDQPFFAQVQLVASHRGDWWQSVREQSKHPVNPEEVVLPAYLADDPVVRLDWATYLDQIEYLDAEVGLIFDELREKNMLDNTIVIFIGDNGRCNIRGKGYLYESGLNIPLLVYLPDASQAGTIRKELVSSIDITASVLDWAGVKIPDFVDGRPLLINGKERKEVFSSRDLWDEIDEKSRSITDRKWKYIRNDKIDISYDAHQAYLEFYRPAVHIMRALNERGELTSIQSAWFSAQKPKEELYNLQEDPYELKNLAEDKKYGKILKKYSEKAQAYELANAPYDTEVDPITPKSVPVLQWVKKHRPDEYQRMLEGEEIGFKQMTSEWKSWKSKQSKNF